MRTLMGAALITLFIPLAMAQSAEEKVSVGPWEIATSFRGSTFVHCEMRRGVEGLGVTFLRAEDGRVLLLDSSKWKLDRGKTYNVKLAAGGSRILPSSGTTSVAPSPRTSRLSALREVPADDRSTRHLRSSANTFHSV